MGDRFFYWGWKPDNKVFKEYNRIIVSQPQLIKLLMNWKLTCLINKVGFGGWSVFYWGLKPDNKVFKEYNLIIVSQPQ